jgi:ELWxxDGT repeat protein
MVLTYAEIPFDKVYDDEVLDDKLILVIETSAEGKELWVTDGTTAGTQLVKDIIPGLTGSNPTNLLVYKHHLYFTADSTPGDRQLYVTDGTAAGTHTVRPSGGVKNALDATIFNGFTEYNGSIYYSAYHDSTTCNELWWFTDTATYNNNVPYTASGTHTFNIYPNPNNGTFTIETTNNFKNGSVSMYDIMGREVYQSPITNSKFSITINQPKGIYLVKLQLDDAVLTKHIVVE